MTSLNEESIRQALAGDMLVGREVRVLPEVGSTNDYLKEAARGGAPEGLAVLAERQTAGKGRLGRSFQSPAGLGLWMSVLLRPTCPPERLPPVTALTAAACLALHHLALLAWNDAPSFSDGDEALLWARFSREVEHDEANFFALAEALADLEQWPLAQIFQQ